MKRLKRLALLATVMAVVSASALALSGTASAHSCGFNTDQYYRHCGNTHVLLDARSFWGTTYRNICVGPGDTYLGYLSYWRIVNAWYIGRLC
jgi:hypothetical protein